MTNTNNQATMLEDMGLLTISIGEKVPGWEQMKDRCFVSDFACTYDFYSKSNVGILYVMFEDMTASEQFTLEHSPFICGVTRFKHLSLTLAFKDSN